MVDVLTELKEDLRRERFETFVKKRIWSITSILAVILGFTWAAGWFQDKEIREQEEQGAALVETIKSGDKDAQHTVFSEMIGSDEKGYQFIGILKQAGDLAQNGKPEEAISKLENYPVRNNELSDFALMQASFLRIEHKLYPEKGIENLNRLSAGGSPWRPMAQEMLAFEDFRNGNNIASREKFQILSTEMGVPQGIAERARKMLKIIPVDVGNETENIKTPAEK